MRKTLFTKRIVFKSLISYLSSVLVRLADGNTPHEGRVELYYQCQWGTITGYDWGIEEANVICRQLGYPSASQAWRRHHFGLGSGPVILSDVECHRNESSIEQCDHSGVYSHYYYSHDYEVGVTCNVAIPPRGEFLPEIHCLIRR